MYSLSIRLTGVILVLFVLIWNTVKSNYNDIDEHYDNEFTGAKYYIYPNYKGVSLIVSLTNDTVIYCMGFLVSDENIKKKELHAYRYVLTLAGCVKHDNFNDVRVLLRGNPYLNHDEKFIREGKVISYPNYDKDLHNGDIVLIRMSSVYLGISYPISNMSPRKLLNNTDLHSRTEVVMWTDPVQYKPIRLKNISIALRQIQVLHYSSDLKKCPAQSNVKVSANEEKHWYMFFCSDFTEPTRNLIENPGALVMYTGTVIGLYSYSFSKPIENNGSRLQIKAAQIHRYTLLYWYRPWIEFAITSDKRRATDDPDGYGEYNATADDGDADGGPSSPSSPADVPPAPHYFDGDTAYDGLSDGVNPCAGRAAATSPARRFRLPFVLSWCGLVSAYARR